jgi:hypothetical protein
MCIYREEILCFNPLLFLPLAILKIESKVDESTGGGSVKTTLELDISYM